MKKILDLLFSHRHLDTETAKKIMLGIGKGDYNDAETAAFITVYLMRSVSIAELTGFREALLEMCLPVTITADGVTDIVGTGGDGKHTFNISTLSCFLVAGAGYRVAKHGNYGVSSVSGASNLMEHLGYRFSSDSEKLQKELDVANICFLHAPLFHPALKTVAGIRRNLGLRTIFNMLGPLVHPANPSHQVIGVCHLEIARYYAYLLQPTQTEFLILHSLDGCDEISLTDDVKIITRRGETIYSPGVLGKRTVHFSDIHGGDSVAAAAGIFSRILNGKGSWAQNAVVLANAAVAIQHLNKGMDYDTAFESAVNSLESGMALKQFQRLMQLQL
jgi:anthranilate phosphoribosyltransferase